MKISFGVPLLVAIGLVPTCFFAQAPSRAEPVLVPIAGVHNYGGDGKPGSGVAVEVIHGFRVTKIHRIRVVFENSDPEVVNGKGREPEKIKKWFSELEKPRKQYTAGLFANGPPWLDAPKSDADPGAAEIHCRVTKVDPRAGYGTLVVVAFPLVIPGPMRLGQMTMSVTLLSDGKPLLHTDAAFSFSEQSGLHAGLTGALRYAGEWTGELLRAVWRGEKSLPADAAQAPMASPMQQPGVATSSPVPAAPAVPAPAP